LGKGERRYVIDRYVGMLGDLLQREQLRAAEPAVPFSGASDPWPWCLLVGLIGGLGIGLVQLARVLRR
jgi:hypothetical protein